LNLFINEPQTI